MPNRLLTLNDMWKLVGTPVKDLERICELGLLPAEKIDGAWVIWEDDFKKWWEAKQRNVGKLRHPPPQDDDPF